MTDNVDMIIVGIIAPLIVWAIWYYSAYKKANKKQMYLATTICATAGAVIIFGALIGVIVGIVLGCIMDRAYKKNEKPNDDQDEQQKKDEDVDNKNHYVDGNHDNQ